MFKNKVCILGLGYIGLPTASVLANRGYMVYGVDINKNVVDTINRGDIHIVEPDLDTFVKSAVGSGNLKAFDTPKKADIFIIAVPTPFHDGYIPNIDYVVDAAKSIAPCLEKDNLVILESTSPVGTTNKIREVINSIRPDLAGLIYYAHCPERVLPGKIVRELIENDRIIGGIDAMSTLRAKEFYETFVEGQTLTTDDKTAELSKLVENAFRDVNIAFANELSMICDGLGIDTKELISLANRHPRVDILNPGVGVGGHCIAVDPYFIINSDKENSRLIAMARNVNHKKTEWVIGKIIEAIEEFESLNKRLPKVSCLGLAYKPDIDDLRESPALEVVSRLVSAYGDNIMPVEPNIQSHTSLKIYEQDNAIASADIVVVLVRHKVFANICTSAKVLDFA